MKHWRIAVAVVVATIAVIGAAQAITDNAFNYSSAKVGFFSINPVALTSDSSLMDYSRDATRLSREGGAGECFGGGVNLPQGAKMTNLVVWYQSSDIGLDPEFFLQRQRHSDGTLQTIAHIVGHDDTGLRKTASVVVASTLAAVDNVNFSYAFRACLSAIPNTFNAARIRYTYTSAGD